MTRPCPLCGWVHDSSTVRAIDRFNPDGPSGYRATNPGALVRDTRDEAMRDACESKRGSK